MAQQWLVVGGTQQGGILVREGEATSSKAFDNRLATASVVDQVELKGDRLKYKLLTGSGPPEGWVAVKISGKVLMEKHLETATYTAKVSTGNTSNEADDSRSLWGPIPENVWKSFPKLKEGDGLRPKSLKEFKERVNNDDVGDYWGLKFPFTPKQFQAMGPEWLTLAMHTAGTLSKDNAITKFLEFDVKAEDVSKQDAENAKWGGAGLKILMRVEYRYGDPQGMFVKMPHEYSTKNERVKNSHNNGGMMDWSEVTFYNVCGGRFGRLPFKSPQMYFCDMSRKTSNFINIVERIPYAPTGTMEVAAGEYYPAPEKYRDWALPKNGVDLYYAHAKALAQFFSWHHLTSKRTSQLGEVFSSMGEHLSPIHALVRDSGAYNSQKRDSFIGDVLGKDQGTQAMAAAMGFPPATAKGFLDLAKEFITNSCPQAFPKELVAPAYINKFITEAEEMSKYCGEMNFYTAAIPEFYSLCHPNAQVDNAFYWKNTAGEAQCGLLDWGGVGFNTIPSCLGNGWMGAEPEVMEEHEDKLVKLFVDEYEKVTGFRFDCDDLLMNLKLAQCSVFYGCCANVGMCLRIFKKEEWANMKGRKDPKIDENFLLRCYFVQIHLWLKMWGLQNSPYRYFQKWRKRVKLTQK